MRMDENGEFGIANYEMCAPQPMIDKRQLTQLLTRETTKHFGVHGMWSGL